MRPSAGFMRLLAATFLMSFDLPALAQLADCTIGFEPPDCPDTTPECGAEFTGGTGCVMIGVGDCYDRGSYSYAVDPGSGLTIDLADDLLKLSVFFSGSNGSSGTMDFLDAQGQIVDSISAIGDCFVSMPDTQTIGFSTPVVRIEVTAVNDSVWIDTFHLNPPAQCGDDVLDAGEECDDGNSTNGDGCDNNCTMTHCGNGIVAGGEECDDGNSTNGDGCDNNCTMTRCGNGIVAGGEDCDDGNSVNSDGCENDCTATPTSTPPPDRDGDSVPDSSDNCPDDPNKINEDECGCGVPDTDTDGDNIADCHESDSPPCSASVGLVTFPLFLLGYAAMRVTRRKPLRRRGW